MKLFFSEHPLLSVGSLLPTTSPLPPPFDTPLYARSLPSPSTLPLPHTFMSLSSPSLFPPSLHTSSPPSLLFFHLPSPLSLSPSLPLYTPPLSSPPRCRDSSGNSIPVEIENGNPLLIVDQVAQGLITLNYSNNADDAIFSQIFFSLPSTIRFLSLVDVSAWEEGGKERGGGMLICGLFSLDAAAPRSGVH